MFSAQLQTSSHLFLSTIWRKKHDYYQFYYTFSHFYTKTTNITIKMQLIYELNPQIYCNRVVLSLYNRNFVQIFILIRISIAFLRLQDQNVTGYSTPYNLTLSPLSLKKRPINFPVSINVIFLSLLTDCIIHANILKI